MKMVSVIGLGIMACLALLFPAGGLAPAAAAEGVPTAVIDPGAREGIRGATFSVDFVVDPSGCGVSGGEMNVSFDPSIMSATDMVAGDLFGANPLVGTRQIDNSAGTLKYALARVGPTAPPTSTGKFATITFTVKSTAGTGTYPIRITFIGLADETFEDIPGILTTDGSVTVPGAQAGTIEVTANLAGATFGITGAAGYGGTVPWSANSAPPGDYTLAWGNIAGYTTPPGETKTLAAGGTISFQGVYAPVSPADRAPSVATSAASGSGTDSVTLNGDLTDPGTAASVQLSFQWGLTADYGGSTAPATTAGTVAFSRALSGLAPGTTYHFRAVAVGDGAAYGDDLTFTTGTEPAVPPLVTTLDAGRIETTSARLNGELTSMGTAAGVTVSFAWGTTSGGPYPNEAGGLALAGSGAFYFDLEGLAAGSTYYYQARVVGDGTSNGAEKGFSTGAETPPADTPPAQTPSADTTPDETPVARAPVIQALTAGGGRQGDALTVTISGSGLGGTTVVEFGDGISVTDLTVVSDGEISARISIDGDAAAGDRDVTVTTPGGGYTMIGGFVVDEAGAGMQLWVYPVAVAGGVVGLGLLASLAVWLRRRLAQ